MKCNDIIEILNRHFPERDACSWDNVGLQVGRFDKEVKRIYLALDATEEIIDEAINMKADFLITHHPMIFSGIKKINQKEFIGRRVLSLVSNDISYYAMHTNYDIHGMADYSMDKLKICHGEPLEVTGEKDGLPIGIGKVAELDEKLTLCEMAKQVKEAFELENVRVYGDPDTYVKKVAICPGSGKSEISLALAHHADVYITGDVGHHDCIDAVEQGLNMIDAGHYGVEHIFIEDMKSFLTRELKDVDVICAPIRHPFFNI